MLGLFVLLPQRCLSPVLVLVGELCMDVVALFIKRGESLFRVSTDIFLRCTDIAVTRHVPILTFR
jgi:hypothetical protein